MCGFAGEFLFDHAAGRASLDLAEAMARRLAHRGPDSAGACASPCGRCAMGFRRLKVIDLQRSEQPMSSPDGHVTLVFNGEIYNYRALRNDLIGQGYRFSTQGDTEVLLAMYERYGLEAMCERLEGMFAAAIFDSRELASTGRSRLHLLRDRLGVKPLWYALLDDRVVFASEAKALLACPRVDSAADANALGYYLTLGYVPAPKSFWRGIVKLPPASCVTFEQGAAQPQRWWRPPTTITPISRADAAARTRELLIDAVAKRMRSDVPLGVLLSGGADSAIVAALAALATDAAPLSADGSLDTLTSNDYTLKTFCAGFAESRFDERPFAREMAARIGSDHLELQIEPEPAMIDAIAAAYDEPFADSSALATMLLSRLVRGHVTVALGGDGGDEAFGGYDRHRAMWLIQRMGLFQSLAVIGGGALLDRVASRDEKSRLRRFVRFARGVNAPPTLRYLGYRRLISAPQLNELVTDDLAGAVDLNEPVEWFADLFEDGDFPTDLGAAQRCDILSYLPDDLLVKADIASMAASLELRSPMLDHHVIEFGLSLPDELKVDRRGNKRILREAFGELIGRDVFDRSKRGFAVPIDHWLRGPLLAELKATLLDRSFIDQGWLRPTAMERMIADHAEGRADHRHGLWALLMLGKFAATAKT